MIVFSPHRSVVAAEFETRNSIPNFVGVFLIDPVKPVHSTETLANEIGIYQMD